MARPEIGRAHVEQESGLAGVERALAQDQQAPAPLHVAVQPGCLRLAPPGGAGEHDDLVGREIALGVDHAKVGLRLQQHARRALVVRLGAGAPQPQVGRRASADPIGLDLLDVLERLADGPVGVRFHLAQGVELVAEIAGRAKGDHGRRLVAEGVGVLEPAKLAPRGVKLAAHGHHRRAGVAKEPGPHRELVVTAPGGGQVLQVVLRVVLVHPEMDVAVGRVELGRAVVIDRGAGVVAVQELVARAHHVLPLAHAVQEGSLRIVHVHALLPHPPAARLAVAGGPGVADVVPKAVHVIAATDLLGLGQDQLQVAAAGAEVLPGGKRARVVRPGVGVPVHGSDRAVGVVHAPLGVRLGVVDRPADGEIDRAAHADLVAGLDLRAQEIDSQRGVHAARFCGIVSPAVVPLAKDIDQVDVADLQRFLERTLGKAAPHAGDVLGGVKVEVDLSSRYGWHWFSPLRCLQAPGILERTLLENCHCEWPTALRRRAF